VQAELMAAEHRRRGFTQFVALAGHPFLVARDGRLVSVAPIDILSWTAHTAAGFADVTAARRQIAPKAAGEIRITGRATAFAKQQLKAQGWTVVEGTRL
jgi:hypothetical protein